MNIRVAFVLALTALTSCANLPPAAHEILDEQSASTMLVATKPLVFARERSDVAAHARDYATLVAVEVDRSGDYGEYLLLYRWSTVDRRMAAAPATDAGLRQRRALHVPDHGDVIPRAYRVDVATLHFIAASREVIVRMPQEPLDTPFRLWEDGRRSLTQFLRQAAAP